MKRIFISILLSAVAFFLWYLSVHSVRHASQIEGSRQTKDSEQQHGAGSDVRGIPSRLTRGHDSMNVPLVKVQGETNAPSTFAPRGWSFESGGKGALSDPNGRVILSGSKEKPIYGAEASPDGKAILVYFGSGKYILYDSNGKPIVEIPDLAEKAMSAICWKWKDSTHLVGVSEESALVDGFSESDVLPKRTLFFLFSITDRVPIVSVSLPPVPPGTVVRLEGVTPSGALLLSAVKPENYFGGTPEKVIGTYDLH